MAKRKARKSASNEARRLKSAKEIARVERVEQIMSMRRQGWSLRAIAASLVPPLSAMGVKKIIDRELAEMVFEDTTAVRKLELARLDELQTAHHMNAVGGDQFATTQVLAIMDRRARLSGINAADKSIVAAVVSTDDPRASLEAKMQLMAERMEAADKAKAALPA